MEYKFLENNPQILVQLTDLRIIIMLNRNSEEFMGNI